MEQSSFIELPTESDVIRILKHQVLSSLSLFFRQYIPFYKIVCIKCSVFRNAFFSVRNFTPLHNLNYIHPTL